MENKIIFQNIILKFIFPIFGFYREYLLGKSYWKDGTCKDGTASVYLKVFKKYWNSTSLFENSDPLSFKQLCRATTLLLALIGISFMGLRPVSFRFRMNGIKIFIFLKKYIFFFLNIHIYVESFLYS